MCDYHLHVFHHCESTKNMSETTPEQLYLDGNIKY